LLEIILKYLKVFIKFNKSTFVGKSDSNFKKLLEYFTDEIFASAWFQLKKIKNFFTDKVFVGKSG
jgi:hypothetical protein